MNERTERVALAITKTLHGDPKQPREINGLTYNEIFAVVSATCEFWEKSAYEYLQREREHANKPPQQSDLFAPQKT